MNEYWLKPGYENHPYRYMAEKGKSEYLIKLMWKGQNDFGWDFGDPGNVLELGCNVGRNLLFIQNYFPSMVAWGIEANKMAVDIAEAAGLDVEKGNIEEAEYSDPNLIFTMAVLEHIPNEDIGKVVDQINGTDAKYLITIEDEYWPGDEPGHHFPRNYKDLFETSGEWTEVWSGRPTGPKRLMIRWGGYVEGFNEFFRARMFERR